MGVMKDNHITSPHLTAIPLRSIAAGELGGYIGEPAGQLDIGSIETISPHVQVLLCQWIIWECEDETN
jgi:hypothetical protein